MVSNMWSLPFLFNLTFSSVLFLIFLISLCNIHLSFLLHITEYNRLEIFIKEFILVHYFYSRIRGCTWWHCSCGIFFPEVTRLPTIWSYRIQTPAIGSISKYCSFSKSILVIAYNGDEISTGVQENKLYSNNSSNMLFFF